MAKGAKHLDLSKLPDRPKLKKPVSKRHWLLREIQGRYLAIGAMVLVGVFCAWIAVTVWGYRKDLPSIERVYNIKPRLITKLYDHDGNQFYDFYVEKRVLTPFDKIPKQMIQALLASEDRDFYDHWGVQWTAIVRGVIIRPLRGLRAQGGSTITQQLARSLFLTRERTIARKVKEWMTAVRLERRYAKNEILEMYLNQNYYGAGAYGVQAAAQTYFAKDAEDLDVSEAAVLIGLLPAPTRYSPRRNEELSRQRRNVVLNAMVDVGYLDQATYDSLSVLPIMLRTAEPEPRVGDYFAEDVRRYLEETYGEDTLYTEGLSIQTTIDTSWQREAEEVVDSHLDSLQAVLEARHKPTDRRFYLPVYDSTTGETTLVHKKLQAALVAIDNATGEVRAMVGGYDFADSKWNRATQATRQPGSSFKPFVLTAAVDAGYMPRDTIYDSPIVMNIPGYGEWSPRNFDEKFRGPITIREGYQDSRNLVSIRLLQKLDPQRAVFFAKKMGITTPIKPVASLAIGSEEVTLLDLTSAYTTFPNGGIRTKPRMIRKVTDRFGGILEDHPAPEQEEVLSAKVAYTVLHVLKSVIDRGTGKGARRRGFRRPAAGKTGTTNEYMDNWFIGFTPQVTCGVWVGYDLKTPIGGFHTGTGAATALPIWTEFMKFACRDLPPIDFPVPDGIILYRACDQSYMRASEFCPSTHEEVAVDPHDTVDVCPIHGLDEKGQPLRKKKIRL
jgi:penicillin-binding protein 1A